MRLCKSSNTRDISKATIFVARPSFANQLLLRRKTISDGALSVILCSVRYIPKRGSRMIAQCPSPHFYSNILDVAQKAGETAAYYFVKVILLRSRIVSRPLSAGLSAGKASSGIAEGVWLALGYTVEFWAY